MIVGLSSSESEFRGKIRHVVWRNENYVVENFDKKFTLLFFSNKLKYVLENILFSSKIQTVAQLKVPFSKITFILSKENIFMTLVEDSLLVSRIHNNIHNILREILQFSWEIFSQSNIHYSVVRLLYLKSSCFKNVQHSFVE